MCIPHVCGTCTARAWHAQVAYLFRHRAALAQGDRPIHFFTDVVRPFPSPLAPVPTVPWPHPSDHPLQVRRALASGEAHGLDEHIYGPAWGVGGAQGYMDKSSAAKVRSQPVTPNP